MATPKQQREGIATKIVNGVMRTLYVYSSPAAVVQSPAIVVQPAIPVSANFNESNRMGDEWRWRVWVMAALRSDTEVLYDELDELLYDDEHGIRQVLHHDDLIDDQTRLVVTGIREYGMVGTFNSQRWISAQIMVSVHTQG